MGFMASSPWSHAAPTQYSHSDPHLSTQSRPWLTQATFHPIRARLGSSTGCLKGAQEYSPVDLVTPVLSPWVAM